MINEAGIKNRQNFEKRCQLVFIYNGVGRGGEIKFQQYSDWMWDSRFDTIYTTWHESKTLQHYAIPMVPEKSNYVCDWYHSLGCFYAVEQGLFRNTKNSSVSDFVFPRLHKLRDNTITKNLNKCIRENLPSGTTEKIKRSFSSRSIRKGGINELSQHREIGFFDSIARSGHSAGTAQEVYIDRTSIVAALPGGLALNGWDDVRGIAHPPRLSCIGEEGSKQAENMLSKVFVISHDDFLPNGVLRPILRSCLASLIMYYPLTEKELGIQHILVVSIRNAAHLAAIKETNSSSPYQVLLLWSNIIAEDFKCQNRSVKDIDSSEEILPTLNTMCSMMNSIQGKMTEIMYEQKDQKMCIQGLQEQLLTLMDQNKEIMKENDTMKRKMSVIRTPPSVKSSMEDSIYNAPTPEESRPNKRIKYEDTETKEVILDCREVVVPNRDTSNPKRKALIHPLKSKQTYSKGMTISGIIVELFVDGCFKGMESFQLQFMNVAGISSNEKKKLFDAMELVDFVISDSQRTLLTREDLSMDKVHHIAQYIEKQSIKKMCHLEGKSFNSRERGTYIALG